ncbi:MAG: 3-phosphoglycerate dehydrogenase family protein, partial [Clostridia bacterium]
MNKVHCLNKISPIGTDLFEKSYEIGASLEEACCVLVRSSSMHDISFSQNLLAIARAGAGVNNIPLDKCSDEGIVVFNTPGANANAVKEMVLASLFMTSRKIVPSIEWAKTLKGKGDEVSALVEKGKSNFAGPELLGKTLGVIGLGAIGVLVANAAESLGMKVYGYDPYLSVNSAWSLSHSVNHANELDEIYANCDYITIHVPLTETTKNLVNEDSIAKMKDNVRLLNFSRGDLVNSEAVISALATGKVSAYATDFPDDSLIGVDGVLAIPHLGASTPESEDNCAIMAVNQLQDYIENGNIVNSVNMPALSSARVPDCKRLCAIHRNVPNTIASLAETLGNSNLNIENMISKSRGDYAYAMFDVKGEISQTLISY